MSKPTTARTIAPDVLVIGGGNAALCAAITAAEAGARITILEAAPKPYRGGNSRHTRNFRCMHRESMSVLTESYEEDEYFDDLIRVTGGKTDEALARLVIRSSEGCLAWMERHGVRFQPSLSGTLSLSRTISSWSLVISRATAASRSPKTASKSAKHFASLLGDSRSTIVASTSANGLK